MLLVAIMGPQTLFFCSFSTPKNTVQLSFIPIFQAILPLSFVFSHISCPFIQFHYYPVLSRKRKKVKWTGTESFDRLKNDPLVELWKSNVQDLRIKISVVRSSIARIQCNKVGRDKPDRVIAGSHHQGRKNC